MFLCCPLPRHHQVTIVDGDLVTVVLDHGAGETTVPVSHCRQRFEFGHLVFIESCTDSLVDFFDKRCSKWDDSKARSSAKVAEGGQAN